MALVSVIHCRSTLRSAECVELREAVTGIDALEGEKAREMKSGRFDMHEPIRLSPLCVACCAVLCMLAASKADFGTCAELPKSCYKRCAPPDNLY